MPKKAMTTEEYFKKLNKEDKSSIFDMHNREPINFIPTGSWVLDTIIGDGTMTDKPGGFPRGHIVEVFGDESSGKTTVALSGIAMAQEMGELGILIDFEQTFHPDYAEKIGVNLDKDKFIVSRPNHFQQGARQIKDMLLMKPAIIVVDSVSAMLPKEFLEGNVDEAGRIGLQAQLMSAFLGIISKYIPESNCCLLFTNQLRSVIKKSKYDTGPDEESSGGRALKFYSSLRLKLKKGKVEKIDRKSRITGKKEKEPLNVLTKATVVKSKIDKPFRTAPLHIRFAEGVDNIFSIIELAVNTGVIKQSGAFYSFTENNKQLVKKQGKEQLWQALNDNPQLFEKLQKTLIVREDKYAKEEYAEKEDNNTVDEMDDLLVSVSDKFLEKQQEKNEKEE